MKELIYVILILVFGAYTLVCLRTDGWRKVAIPLGLCSIYGVLCWTYFASNGTCRGAWLSFLPTNMTVYAQLLDEPRSIYLFGVEEGIVKCLTLPWSKQVAEEVYGLGEGGGEFMYDSSFGQENQFYPPPIEAMPPKSY
jgi:hypothetical protein